MTNSASPDVRRLLRLAERMGLPANEAIHQVRDLSPEIDTTDRISREPATDDRRPRD